MKPIIVEDPPNECGKEKKVLTQTRTSLESLGVFSPKQKLKVNTN
jgi:hypothetical protein